MKKLICDSCKKEIKDLRGKQIKAKLCIKCADELKDDWKLSFLENVENVSF